MSTPSFTFAVVYRWRLVAGMEKPFREAWERTTIALMRHRGALGSRLHRADDGTYLAYAQWPDKSHWERSRQAGAVDAEAAAVMRDAIAEAFDPILLEPVADHLQHD